MHFHFNTSQMRELSLWYYDILDPKKQFEDVGMTDEAWWTISTNYLSHCSTFLSNWLIWIDCSFVLSSYFMEKQTGQPWVANTRFQDQALFCRLTVGEAQKAKELQEGIPSLSCMVKGWASCHQTHEEDILLFFLREGKHRKSSKNMQKPFQLEPIQTFSTKPNQ